MLDDQPGFHTSTETLCHTYHTAYAQTFITGRWLDDLSNHSNHSTSTESLDNVECVKRQLAAPSLCARHYRRTESKPLYILYLYDDLFFFKTNLYRWTNIFKILPNLELRRLHLDLIFCYKVVFGLVGVNIDDFFQFNHAANTRGHAYKLFKSRSNIRKKNLLNALLMCGTDCRHLSALHHCQHSGEQYRKLILVSSWYAHDYSILQYFFITFTPFFFFKLIF